WLEHWLHLSEVDKGGEYVEAGNAERTGVNSKKLCIARQDKKRIYRPGVNSKKLKNSREGGTIYVDGACDCTGIM
ncbi:unnamed protein product, partial [Mycena citricolor]